MKTFLQKLTRLEPCIPFILFFSMAFHWLVLIINSNQWAHVYDVGLTLIVIIEKSKRDVMDRIESLNRSQSSE